MNRILPIIVLGFLVIILDKICLNSFNATQGVYASIAHVTYWIVFIVSTYTAMIWSLWSYGRQGRPRSPTFNLIAGFGFAAMSIKLLMVMMILSFQLILWLMSFIYHIDQLSDIGGLAIFSIGLLLLMVMLYGIIYGKYNYQIERVDIWSPKLPKSFSGLRVVQISDIHAGTWDDVTLVSKGIDMIKAEQADLILFTGDLVNGHKDEIDPFIELFASLDAPLGKFAVLGNHDYVGIPRDQTLASAYWNDLIQKFELMGFELLLNSHHVIDNDHDRITLVGVENWGDGRFFPKRGDLDIALEGTATDSFTLLMSHDPSHWHHKVLNDDRMIELTLSGHTHGMQIGLRWGKHAWSPVKYRYKYWMGHYKVMGRQLYVNRGLGILGFPGRVAMWPEITVLTLLSTDDHN